MISKKNITVLIIDDEPDILELMEEEFRYCGYNTLTAMSGNEAVQVLQKTPVDIVVSDYKMPNGNGMVVLDYVNKMSSRPDFFFVSGQADVSIEDALKAGAKKFFTKPFDLDELIRQIESTVK
ncbi:MAG: response regulator [Bacteriovoracaceae bacterium]|jgi:DNA-binding NtrC family response regulator|nr:response regulator [Bacteriovoracaceae bacterium]